MIFETRVLGPFVNNIFFLGDEDERTGVVIDASFIAERIVETIGSLDLKIAAIILTHGHLDHTVGAGRVREATGAPILIHKEDLWLYEHQNEQAQMFGMSAPELPKPDRFIEEGDVIDFGGHALKVIHTPGHTPGSVSLSTEIEGRDVVFTGDTLFRRGIGRTDLWGGSLDQELDSIRRRLFTLPDKTAAYTGHGPETSIGEEKASNPFLSLTS